MPLDGTDPEFFGDPRLDKLGQIERLLINEWNWCKHRLRDEHGRYCLAGAMQAVEALQLLKPIILRAARDVGGRHYWRIESFNDHPYTTHADILAVLQRARENIIAGMIEANSSRLRARWALAFRTFGSDPRTGITSVTRASSRPPHDAHTRGVPAVGSENVTTSRVREICKIPR